MNSLRQHLASHRAHPKDHSRLSRAVRSAAFGTVLALALVACGEPTESGVDAEAADAEPAAQETSAAEEPVIEEPAAEEPAAEASEEPAPVEEEVEEPAEDAGQEQAATDPGVVTGPDGLICDLPVDAAGQPMDPDAYLELVGPLNGQLEQLAYDMDGALAELEEGISDGPSLADDLSEFAYRYAEITAPVIDLTPPDGAEDWHASLTASWLSVCVSLADGYAGVTEGDDDRFQAFADSLREFPSLINELHANAMCGPFEEC